MKKLALLVLLALAPLLSSSKLRSLNYYEVETFGGACDGTTDDTAAFLEAEDAADNVGGEIVIPATGSGCVLTQDFVVSSYVKIRCEKGAIIKADSSATITNGLISFVAAEFSSIEGCRINMNGLAKAAISASSGAHQLAIRDNWIFGGANTAGANHTLVSLASMSGENAIVGNRVDCAAHVNATGDSGIAVGGTSATFSIRGNTANGCDGVGIKINSGTAQLDGNAVNMPTSTADTDAIGIDVQGGTATIVDAYVSDVAQASGIGIRLAGAAGGSVSDSKVVTSGSGAIGFVSGTRASVTGNYCTASGNSAICYQSNGVGTTLSANRHVLSGTGSIGYDVKAGYSTIQGNAGSVTVAGNAQYHIRVAGVAEEMVITGNLFTGGAWGFAPTQVLADFAVGPINSTLVGNDFREMTACSAILTTGARFVGNRVVWGGDSSTMLCIGDDRTLGSATGYDHIQVVGNLFYCTNCTPMVKLAKEGKRCEDDNVNEFQVCNSDADCGGVTNACDTLVLKNLVISGNGFLTAGGAVVQIALSIGSDYDGDSPTTSAIQIGDNQFGLGETTDKPLQFPGASFASKVTNVSLGVNNYTAGATYKTDWDATMGLDFMALAIGTSAQTAIGGSNLGTSTAYYLPFSGYATAATASEDDVKNHVGVSITVSQMCCAYDGTWTSTNKRTMTLRKNKADTAIACDLTASVSKCCDTGSISYSASATPADSADIAAIETGAVTSSAVTCWSQYTE